MDRESIAASSVRSTSSTASRSKHGVVSPNSPCRRKSFTGMASGRPSISAVRANFQPVTPANSPVNQEIAPRKIRASSEKENVKHQAASSSVCAESPVTSKVTKRFMAPTISTASKIAVSPKSKVLSERNETVRSSVSLSDVKSSVRASVELSGTEKALCTSEVTGASLATPVTSRPSKQLTSGDQIHGAPLSLPDGNPNMVAEQLPDNSKTEKVGPKLENVVDSGIESDGRKLTISGEAPDSVTRDNSEVTEPLYPQISESVREEDQPYHEDEESNSNVSTHNSSRPPYDPRSNYLSPRPLFLYYRPNSRTQICPSKNDCIKLEESFMPDDSSDTEVAVETQNGSEESPPLDEEADDYEETCVTRPTTERCNACPKMKSGFYFYGKGKLRSTLLLLAIACLSMTFSDSLGSVVSSYLHKASSVYPLLPPPENLDWATYTFKQLSISYFPDANIFSEKEMGPKFKFANLTFLDQGVCNLPEIMAAENPKKILNRVEYEEKVEKSMPGFEEEEQIVEDHPETNHHETREDSMNAMGSSLLEEEKTEKSTSEEDHYPVYREAEEQDREDTADHLTYESIEVGEDMVEIVPQAEPRDEEGQSHHGNTKDVEKAVAEEISELAPEAEKEPTADHLAYENIEAREDTVEISLQAEAQDEEGQSLHGNTRDVEEAVAEEIPESALEVETLPTQIVEEPDSQENNTNDYHGYIKSESTSEEAMSGELVPSSIPHEENKLWLFVALASFAFLAFAGLCSTLNVKRTKASVVQPTVFQQKCPPENLMASCSLSSGSDGHSYSKGSRSSQMEVEMFGQSYPPETTSSFQRSSSNSEWRNEEIQSTERRKARRNSRASEYSTEMSSFGSFATYEMLHCKHGSGENDALTPVRRSSRIRNKITSP